MKALLLALAGLLALPVAADDKTVYLHYTQTGEGCTLTLDRKEDQGELEHDGCRSDAAKSACAESDKPDACVCLSQGKKLKWKASKASKAEGIEFKVQFVQLDTLGDLQPFKNDNKCGGEAIRFKNNLTCQITEAARTTQAIYQYDVYAMGEGFECKADPRVVVEI